MNYVDPSRLLASTMTEDAPLVMQLLAARMAFSNAGNRRSLFARMDALFADESRPEGGDSWAPARPDASAGDVRLTQMRLRNWKAFERADISFPSVGSARSIVVIGGANGFGKSSILEAYAFGLFGSRALSEAGFLISGASRASGQRRSYRALIEKSLHRSAEAHEDGMCAVTLEFATDDGPLIVERRWYFDEQGKFIDDDEELLVRSGPDRIPLAVPEAMDASSWYQAEIERKILPVELAPFFLFDGEQVERSAERKLSDQVHFALTRLLGLGEFGALTQDLRDYARDRERGIEGADGSALESLQTDMEARESAFELEFAAFQFLQLEIDSHRAERSALLRDLARLGNVSHADLQLLLESRHRLKADYGQAARNLLAVMCDEGPLLLAGAKLIERVDTAIRAEADRQTLGLQSDEIDGLWRRLVAIDPPLGDDDANRLLSRLQKACQAGDGTADAGAHSHLDRKARRNVIERLGSTIASGRRHVSAAIAVLSEVGGELAAAGLAVTKHESGQKDAAELQSRLSHIVEVIEAKEKELRALRLELDDKERLLHPMRAEIAKISESISGAEPRLRASARARQLAIALERHMQKIAGPEHQRFADAVTANYRRLAHKDQIGRIDIFASGEVRLVDRNDQDVTDYRLSAGEAQLFAMSLIAAVGDLLGDRLPLMVDTPLGRLDTQHRQSVLDMFTRRTSQTILLTQPEELTTEHMERIRPFVSGVINIQHSSGEASGVGASTIAPNQIGPIE